MDAARGKRDESVARETTPLLGRNDTEAKTYPLGNKSVLYRLLLCAFCVSLSFGVTQVPWVIIFDVWTRLTHLVSFMSFG